VKDVSFLHGYGGTLFCMLFGSWLGCFYSGGADKQMCCGQLRGVCPSKALVMKGRPFWHQTAELESLLNAHPTANDSLACEIRGYLPLLSRED